MSRESRAQRERRILFRRGAAAIQRYTDSHDLYFCPLCATPFPESVLLLEGCDRAIPNSTVE